MAIESELPAFDDLIRLILTKIYTHWAFLGDIYLEEIFVICAFLGANAIVDGSVGGGNKGGLLGFFGSVEVASEIVGDRRGGDISRQEEIEKDLVWWWWYLGWGWVWGFVNLCCE